MSNRDKEPGVLERYHTLAGDVRQDVAAASARQIMGTIPDGMTDLQISIIISLGMGSTPYHTATTTGAAIKTVWKVGREFKRQISLIAARRQEVLEALAHTGIYVALELGIAALTSLLASLQSGKAKDRLTPSNIASIATSAQAFSMIADRMGRSPDTPRDPQGQKAGVVFSRGFAALGKLADTAGVPVDAKAAGATAAVLPTGAHVTAELDRAARAKARVDVT